MDEAADLARRSPLSPPLLAAARAGAIVALAAMSVATLHAQLVPSFAIACDARYSVALRALGRQLTLFDDGKRIRGKFNVFRTTRELYDRESYVLAAVVGGLSGVWPHLKLGAVACGTLAEILQVRLGTERAVAPVRQVLFGSRQRILFDLLFGRCLFFPPALGLLRRLGRICGSCWIRGFGFEVDDVVAGRFSFLLAHWFLMRSDIRWSFPPR